MALQTRSRRKKGSKVGKRGVLTKNSRSRSMKGYTRGAAKYEKKSGRGQRRDRKGRFA